MSAEAEIKQFIDRILRLKEEQDTLGEDIREVYAEAKGRGYDKTALGNVVSHVRKVQKLGQETLHEREAIFDLYLTAYETGGRAPASARTRENIEEFPVNAKLVATVANAVQTEAGRTALIAAVDIMIKLDENEVPKQVYGDSVDLATAKPNQSVDIPAGGEKSLEIDGSKKECPAEFNSPEQANETQHPVLHATGVKAEMPARSGGVDSMVRVARTEASAVTAGETATNFQPPAFLQEQTKSIRDYRPHCQKPDACGASGLKHCYSCAKLIAPESEVA